MPLPKHFQQIVDCATPLTPVRVIYNPKGSYYELRQTALAALRAADYAEIAEDLADKTHGIAYALKMATVVSEFVFLDLIWTNEKLNLPDPRQQDPEGRVDIVRELAAKIAEHSGLVCWCRVDDFNQERTDFTIFARLDLPLSFHDQNKFPLRSITTFIRKTLFAAGIKSFEVIAPKRTYKTFAGERQFTGYERDIVQIELLLHPA